MNQDCCEKCVWLNEDNTFGCRNPDCPCHSPSSQEPTDAAIMQANYGQEKHSHPLEQAGRAAALKEVVEMIEGMKKDYLKEKEPHMVQKGYGYNTALSDLKQSITKLIENV